MNPLLKIVLVIALLTSCGRHSTKDPELLAEVNDKTLTRSQVAEVIPQHISSTDSLLIAENYIKKWIKDELIYEVAKKNVGKANDEIEALVEEYRRALVRSRYQELLIKTKLTAEIKEDEMLSLYQNHPERFVLKKNLIRGLFLKVNKESPNMEDVRKWLTSTKPETIEQLEKYCIQNGAIFDCFFDRWVDFDEVLQRVPLPRINKTQLLKTKNTIETKDSTYLYFINISEKMYSGEMTPFEYARPQIQEIIINKRKMDYIKQFEEDLYRDGIRKGRVTFYSLE